MLHSRSSSPVRRGVVMAIASVALTLGVAGSAMAGSGASEGKGKVSCEDMAFAYAADAAACAGQLDAR